MHKKPGLNIEMLVGVMDRGFAGLNFIRELVQKDKYFVVRIKNNCKLEFEVETGLVKIGAVS